MQRAAGAEREARVGLALERRQVVKLGRDLGGGLFLLGNDTGFAQALCGDGVGLLASPDALGAAVFVGTLFESFVEPATAIAAGLHGKVAEDLEIRTGLEATNLDLTLGQDGEGGGLDAAHRGELESSALGIKGGHGAGAVDAHEPVAFAAADGGIGERAHFLALAELGEAVADGLGVMLCSQRRWVGFFEPASLTR